MIARADAARIPLRNNSVDLVFGSPPYCDARTYGIAAERACKDWVQWMLHVTTEAMRVSKGPVMWVAAGVTRNRNYQPAPEGLMWEWWNHGGDCNLYRPACYHRVGIPGSGGDDWLRSDWEYVMCFKRRGPLAWADNTAMGHSPKWAPGGDMSYHLADGTRVNQWGKPVRKDGHPTGSDTPIEPGKPAAVQKQPSHRIYTMWRNTDHMEQQQYLPPQKANPGNVISLTVGGGHMGSDLAHENEAPFPERLVEFFVCSFCQPGGLVLDPFSGSGTTASVAKQYGRKWLALDIRQSQCDLTRRRLRSAQPQLFA